MMTIGEAEIKIFKNVRALYEADEARALAKLILCHVCRISKPQLTIKRHDLLEPEEARTANLILNDLLTGKPLQYILGETEFFGLPLKITPAVLIPRPETEELVEWVLEEWQRVEDRKGEALKAKSAGLKEEEVRGWSSDLGVRSILDIGTGSGCISVALKKHLPEAEVYGIDISSEALQIARENAISNNVNVHFFLKDILRSATCHPELPVKYSVIISNPPYVTHAEKEKMHQNVLEHEPHIALFVPDNDPLLFYKAIADLAVSHLNPDGFLFLEINEFLGNETLTMLQAKGFRNAVLRKDLQGKDRMIRAGF